jgi:hypothetical protein
MSKVVELFAGTSDAVRATEVVSVKDILAGALGQQLQSVVVIGRNVQGNIYIASTHEWDKALALMSRATVKIVDAQDGGLDIEEEVPSS